jgi:hypothetical protein
MALYPQDPNYPYGAQVAPPGQFLTGLQRNFPAVAGQIGGGLTSSGYGAGIGAVISAGAKLQEGDNARLVKEMSRKAEKYAKQGVPVEVKQEGGSGLIGATKRFHAGNLRQFKNPMINVTRHGEGSGSILYGKFEAVPHPEDRVETGGPGPAVARSQGMNPTSYSAGSIGGGLASAAGPRMAPAPPRPNMLMQHLQTQQPQQPQMGGAVAPAMAPGVGMANPGGMPQAAPNLAQGATPQTASASAAGRGRGGSLGNAPLAPPLAPNNYNNPGNTNSGGNNPLHRTFRGLLQQGIPDSEESRYYDTYGQAVNQGQTQMNDYLARSGDHSGYEGALQGGFQLGAAQALPQVHQEFKQQQRAYLQDLIRMWRGTRKGGGGYVPNQPGTGFGQTLAAVGGLAQGVGSIIGGIKAG